VETAAAVSAGELSAVELVQGSLDRIEALDGRLGAFLSVGAERALARARELDARRARGSALGPLAGIPIALKDTLCTADQPTTAGSLVLTRRGERDARGRPRDGWQPPYDATAVARLRAADAVPIGKTNLDEFAMGSSTENSAFFPTRNPWDPSRAPGGSSGGSAVAVAARLVPGALGSDTGGSVRQPAAFTGVVGIKPSYGRVSRFGLVAFASSLDQIGPLAGDVRGAAALLEVIAGPDRRDSSSAPRPAGGYLEACGRDVTGLRIGVPDEYFAPGIDAEVERAVRGAIAALGTLGARVEPVSLPHTRHALPSYYVIATAECSANLARYDGVRFGLRRGGDGGLDEMYRATRGDGLGTEVKRRIILGTYVLSSGYYESFYLRAQRARRLVACDFAEAFAKVDLIAAPVSPTVAFALGSRTADPLAMYLADVYALPASLAGLPAMSLPCGRSRTDGLPIGLQLIAPAFAETTMLTAAYALEQSLPPLPAPPLS
jgi:aspartyl-tRNA(Asn)/glutamyl-tRNA(Gln) amidotransferase subunit A